MGWGRVTGRRAPRWATRPHRLGLAGLAGLAMIGLSGCADLGSGDGARPQTVSDRPARSEAAPTPSPTERAAGPRTVALLLPLTGPQGEQGRALEAAARRALTPARASAISLRVLDTQANADGARAAAEQAVADGADLVLGPLYSVTVQAVRPVLQAAGIPAVSFSNNRAVAGDGVYLLGHLPGQQTEALLSFAAAQGHNAVVVVGPDTAYARLVADEVAALSRRGAVHLMDTELFPASTDYNSQVEIVRGLAKRSPGGVVIPTTGLPLVGIAALFDYYNAGPPSVRPMGTDLWERPDTFNEPSLHGGWYVSTSTPPVDDPMAVSNQAAEDDAAERLVSRLLEEPAADDAAEPDASPEDATAEDDGPEAPGADDEAPKRPEIRLSAGPGKLDRLVMDAVALAAAWAEQPSSASEPGTFLTNAAGFRGFSGLFRLLPTGLNERGLNVLEVTPNGPQVVQPAPSSFAPGQTPTVLVRPTDYQTNPWLSAEIDRALAPAERIGARTPVPFAPPLAPTTGPSLRATAPTPPPAGDESVRGAWTGADSGATWRDAPPAPSVTPPGSDPTTTPRTAAGGIPSAPSVTPPRSATSSSGASSSGAAGTTSGRIPPAPPLTAPGASTTTAGAASNRIPPAPPLTAPGGSGTTTTVRASGGIPPAPPLTAPATSYAIPAATSGGIPPAPPLTAPRTPTVTAPDAEGCIWQRHCIDGKCRRVQVCPIES